MAANLSIAPSEGDAWPLAYSSFTRDRSYRVTAYCNRWPDDKQALQLLEKDANIGAPMDGYAFKGAALFSPSPGLLLAVRYRPSPGGYHQRFGLLLTEDSFNKYCFGRFDALPDPFEDLDIKAFERVETPEPISLEKHIQDVYGRSVQEQREIWLNEDVNNIVKLKESQARPQLLEGLMKVLADPAPLVVHGPDETEVDRLRSLLVLRTYLPLSARPRLTFITHALDLNLAIGKASFVGLGSGAPTPDPTRWDGHIADANLVRGRPSLRLTKPPDSAKASKTAANFVDALLELPAEQYLDDQEGYLKDVAPSTRRGWDREKRVWEIGANYRGMLAERSGSAKDSVDYLVEYAPHLASSNRRSEAVSDALDKCVEQLDTGELARAVRVCVSSEAELVGTGVSKDLSLELWDRLAPLIAKSSLDFGKVMGFVDGVWQEDKAHEERWSNLFIDLLAKSMASEEIGTKLQQLEDLSASGRVLSTETGVARFCGQVLNTTADPSKKLDALRYTLGHVKSTEGLTTLISQIGEGTLPWHRSFFVALLENPDTVWDYLAPRSESTDGLNTRLSITDYLDCALSVQPTLKAPYSFWDGLRQRKPGQVEEEDLKALLGRFLLGDSIDHVRERLDWQSQTLDALIELIPVTAADLAVPLLEIPPPFSAESYVKASAILVEGRKAGRLPDIWGKMTASLESIVEWEDLGKSLDFISEVAMNPERGNDPDVDDLFGAAVNRIKQLETSHLMEDEDNVQFYVDALAEYAGIDGLWLNWFKSLVTCLDNRDFYALGEGLVSLRAKSANSNDAVTEGTRLWLAKRQENNADALLEEWFKSLASAGKLEDLKAVLPPLVMSFFQKQENVARIPATKQLARLLRNAWGNVLKLTEHLNDRSDVSLHSFNKDLVQFVTDSDRTEVVSKIADYLQRQGDTESRLERGIGALIEELQKPPGDKDISVVKRGREKYAQLSDAVAGIFILHEVRAAFESPTTGISSDVRFQFVRTVKTEVDDGWSPHHEDYKKSIIRMARSRGPTKDKARLSDLFLWWLGDG